MRCFGLVMVAALFTVGCVSEQECREGTVLVRVDFLAKADVVDGLKVRYRLDEGALSELPALPRPSDTDVGSFALDVRGYANHKQLLLQYAPLKGSRIVGAWQEQVVAIAPGCTRVRCSVGPSDDGGPASDSAYGDDQDPRDSNSDEAGRSGDVERRDTDGEDIRRIDVPLDTPSDPADLGPADLGVNDGDSPSQGDERADGTSDGDGSSGPVGDVPLSLDTAIDLPSDPVGIDADGSSGSIGDVPLCLDTNSDPRNCGRCGHVCSAPTGGTANCREGQCVGLCDKGLVCGATAEGGGSCVDTTSDPKHCGACGQSCLAPVGGDSGCSNSVCTGKCTSGQSVCGADARGGGSCIDLSTAASQCGSCGHVCAAPNGGSPLCSGGACVGRCGVGQTLCGGGANGGGSCVDLGTSSSHCASCDHVCTAPVGGSPACSNSSCTGACPTGQTVCDGTVNGGGTCRDMATDPSNCGACGRVCRAPSLGTPSCSGGACKGSCSGSQIVCGGGLEGGGACIDAARDTQNCGTCGHLCSAPSGGSAGCSAGLCSGTCTSSTATPCGVGPDGGGQCYELGTDLAHCGSCNATTCDLCSSGACYRTWGNYQKFTGSTVIGANLLRGWKINVGAAGTLRKVGVWAGSLTHGVAIKIAIYRDNGSDYPGELLTSATGTINLDRNDIEISDGVVLSATGYWLMLAYEQSTAISANSSGSQTVKTFHVSLSAGAQPPSAFPQGATADYDYQVTNYLVVQ